MAPRPASRKVKVGFRVEDLEHNPHAQLLSNHKYPLSRATRPPLIESKKFMNNVLKDPILSFKAPILGFEV